MTRKAEKPIATPTARADCDARRALFIIEVAGAPAWS
jgi:hypothetical protein